ncbi:MAG: hypothetical protein ACYDHH_30685 [Solirubrobacteraceae bacterium]
MARGRPRRGVLVRTDREAGSASQGDERLARDYHQVDRAVARSAQVARQIVSSYEQFGPDEPWGFADPSGWKCSARYCEAWRNCPGGAGL